MEPKKTTNGNFFDVMHADHPPIDQVSFNACTLPFPASTSSRMRRKISDVGKVLFDSLVRTGVVYIDQSNRCVFDITRVESAYAMLITDRDFDVRQTAPQCSATALIVSRIANQAKTFRQTLKFSAGKRDSYERVLHLMDMIAEAIGPLASYRTFDMDLELAATVFFDDSVSREKLFDIAGNCRKDFMFSEASRLTVVKGEGSVLQSFAVLKDAKPVHIARAVKHSGCFDFSVGRVPTHDEQFMASLAKHLEHVFRRAKMLH